MTKTGNVFVALMITFFVNVSAYPQAAPPPTSQAGQGPPPSQMSAAPSPSPRPSSPASPQMSAAPSTTSAAPSTTSQRPQTPAAPMSSAPSTTSPRPQAPAAAQMSPAAAPQASQASPPPMAQAAPAPQMPPPAPQMPPPPPQMQPPPPVEESVHALQARATVVSPNGQGVTGHFEFFNTQPGDNMVAVRLSVSGLDMVQPLEDHTYHIHTNPIPPSGDCAAAMGHLTPNGIPDSLTCVQNTPELCQLGDLGGKHGLLPPEPVVHRRYTDQFLHFGPEAASILGRSVVIHGSNKSRIACGNIISILDGTADANGMPTGLPSTSTINYPKQAP